MKQPCGKSKRFPFSSEWYPVAQEASQRHGGVLAKPSTNDVQRTIQAGQRPHPSLTDSHPTTRVCESACAAVLEWGVRESMGRRSTPGLAEGLGLPLGDPLACGLRLRLAEADSLPAV